MAEKTWIPRFHKYKKNPLIVPGDLEVGSRSIYNPSVILKGDVFYLFARCEENGDSKTGRICLATSKDGIHFSGAHYVIEPEYSYEIKGCEDPRVTKIDNIYYMTYVGNTSNPGGHVCLARSKDLHKWEKLGVAFEPQTDNWDSDQVKAGVLLPFKVKNHFVMYFLGQKESWKTAIGVAFSKDMKNWEEFKGNPILKPRKDHFDSKGVEPGATPILTNDGILFIYNGWNEQHMHRTGAALLSKNDPTLLIDRAEMPLIKAEEDWELNGPAKNVVFSEGLVNFNDSYYLYYGAADKCVGLATTKEP